jgi:serine/threonine protein kinase/Tfp pilus assembly protein PilF
VSEELLVEVAGAVLDGTPIDWAAVELRADEADRPLIEQLRVMANVADVHRHPPAADSGARLAGAQLPLPGIEPNDSPFPPSGGDQPGSDENRAIDLSGTIVGVYRLIERLGRGGMGEVYLGERADGRFEQRVAVKLVKRGMDSGEILRRFARERRILARLEHPGIAHLFDAGEAADGRPYFVMERVHGEKFTDYCRSQDLPLEDRLRLVAACCDAVDAAHRSLVVHRDLKPSNILVTPGGQVKLLDFGIAKLLGEDEAETHFTRDGGRVLTASYAAPEQILGGDVTMATDVFGLGVVLYEILTGALPYDRRTSTPYELAVRVAHETAERPSIVARRAALASGQGIKGERWGRRLLGDLDTITMKALAHEPERRYVSAAALAEDLRRYLSSRPVEARPDSRGYRLHKFVMRHRLGVAAAGAIAAAVLGALIVSLVETAAARRQAERAAAAQAFLTSLFEQIDPDRYVGSAPTVREILERGSQRIDRDLAGQPELRADMEALLGQVFDQLALPKQGEAEWRRALATRQALFGSRDARTVKVRKGLAISIARQARYAEADPLFEQLLEQEQALGDQRELGSVLLNYGNLKRLTGDFATSEKLLQRSIDLLESTGDSARRSLAGALNNLGLVYWRQGRGREAITVLERALAIHEKNQGPQSTLVAMVKVNLSNVYRDLGDLETAERYGQAALALGEAAYPPNHPSIATILQSLGQIAERRGDRDKARALYEHCIAISESSQPNDPALAYALRHLAALLQEEGETKEAVRLYEHALAVRRKAFGDRHRDVAESWYDVGRARLTVRDVSGAVEALRTSVDIFRAVLPADSPQLASGLFLLGDVLRLNGHPREALAYLEETHAIWQRKPPKNPKDLTDLDVLLADVRVRLARTHS